MKILECRGLLLDMDGVLVDSTPAVDRVWSAWARTHNFDPAETVRLAHGRPSISTVRDLLPNASPEIHLAENSWVEKAEIEDVSDVIALPGARELLAAVPPHQFVVVTSATRGLAEARLRAAGLLGAVRNMVTASDIQRGKPDPEPYQKGAAKLGLAPADCIVVEDAAAGVKSGKAAGARVIGVTATTTADHLRAAGADSIVANCAQLRISSQADSATLYVEILTF